MSQMNNLTARNLYEYGDYFKKSLVLGLIVAIISPILAILLLFGSLLGLGLLAFVVLGAAIAILVFEIMMLIRLFRAKESSPHPELARAFMLMIIAIILSVVSIAGGYIHWTVESACNIGAIVVQLIAWQSLGKYFVIYSQEANPSEGFPMVAGGIKNYVLFTYISLGISLADFIVAFLPYSYTLVIVSVVLMIILLVIAIIIIVAQFKIANGMKMIFSGAPAVQPSTQQYTASVYGAPGSTPQPSIPAAQKERYCSKCGTKIVGEAEFCTSCGETLE